MTMNGIVVSSIRHTGTWFTIGLFRNAGWKETGLNTARHEDNTVYHGHMEKETQIKPALELAKHYPIVIPLRHPFRVEESWRRREQHGFCTTGKMIECLNILLDRFMPLDPLMLPVDSDCREQCLANIETITGVSLETDWQPVNSKKQSHSLRWDELRPSKAIERWCLNNHTFMKMYY